MISLLRQHVHWSGLYTDAMTCTVTLNGNSTVHAYFSGIDPVIMMMTVPLLCSRLVSTRIPPRKVYLILCIQLVYAGLVCATMRGYRDAVLGLLLGYEIVPRILLISNTLVTTMSTHAIMRKKPKCKAAAKLPEGPPVTCGVHDHMGTLHRLVLIVSYRGHGDAGGLPVRFRGRLASRSSDYWRPSDIP
ncbi:unnamed protein product, partial [Ectocarpus sp. 4 AP-2014]